MPLNENSHADAGCSACPIAPTAGVDRRAFLSKAMASAVMLALVACGGADSLSPFTGSASLNISSYPALGTVGGVALVTLNGSLLALVRDTQTSVLALSRVCPHEGGTINQSAGGFTCARHGARFGPTGTWLGGERTSSMRSYPTTFDVTTGAITVG